MAELTEKDFKNWYYEILAEIQYEKLKDQLNERMGIHSVDEITSFEQLIYATNWRDRRLSDPLPGMTHASATELLKKSRQEPVKVYAFPGMRMNWETKYDIQRVREIGELRLAPDDFWVIAATKELASQFISDPRLGYIIQEQEVVLDDVAWFMKKYGYTKGKAYGLVCEGSSQEATKRFKSLCSDPIAVQERFGKLLEDRERVEREKEHAMRLRFNPEYRKAVEEQQRQSEIKRVPMEEYLAGLRSKKESLNLSADRDSLKSLPLEELEQRLYSKDKKLLWMLGRFRQGMTPEEVHALARQTMGTRYGADYETALLLREIESRKPSPALAAIQQSTPAHRTQQLRKELKPFCVSDEFVDSMRMFNRIECLSKAQKEVLKAAFELKVEEAKRYSLSKTVVPADFKSILPYTDTDLYALYYGEAIHSGNGTREYVCGIQDTEVYCRLLKTFYNFVCSSEKAILARSYSEFAGQKVEWRFHQKVFEVGDGWYRSKQIKTCCDNAFVHVKKRVTNASHHDIMMTIENPGAPILPVIRFRVVRQVPNSKAYR